MIPTRTLNSGFEMPLLGLGTHGMDGAAGAAAMAGAISAGYRLLDTAAKYGNEWAVGEAIRRSGARRQDLFISTKLRGADHGRYKTRAAVSASLDRLRLDYLDLYLIHWPLPRLGLFTESWEAMLELAAEGLIRSAGVSNFKPAHVAALIEATGVAPAVDQIELSPALPRRGIVAYLTRAGVLPQAWGPLGIGHQVPGSAAVTAIARAHGATAAQVVLRWAVQQGIAVIPTSARPERQRANLQIFGFSLSDAEMTALAALEIPHPCAHDLILPGGAAVAGPASALAHRAATWSARRRVGACPLTAARNVSLSSANRVAGVTAVTVAVRGVRRSSAISPRPVPRPRTPRGRPSTQTATCPSAMA